MRKKEFLIISLFIGFAIISSRCSEPPKPKMISSKSNMVVLDEEIITVCPTEMKWIHGQYCTKVTQLCKNYKESLESTPFARCLEFQKTECIGKLIEMNFCIDTNEYSNTPDKLPLSDISWNDSQAICSSEGKRLCSESEWEFSCEGEEMYPYTTGYTRPTNECNMDIEKNVVCNEKLCDYRKPIDENLKCISPFGVHNMSGNVDEWIIVPPYAHSKNPDLIMKSALKGGHWLPVRNRCRPKTVDHNEVFHQISVGFRCCKDLKEEE